MGDFYSEGSIRSALNSKGVALVRFSWESECWPLLKNPDGTPKYTWQQCLARQRQDIAACPEAQTAEWVGIDVEPADASKSNMGTGLFDWSRGEGNYVDAVASFATLVAGLPGKKFGYKLPCPAVPQKGGGWSEDPHWYDSGRLTQRLGNIFDAACATITGVDLRSDREMLWRLRTIEDLYRPVPHYPVGRQFIGLHLSDGPAIVTAGRLAAQLGHPVIVWWCDDPRQPQGYRAYLDLAGRVKDAVEAA